MEATAGIDKKWLATLIKQQNYGEKLVDILGLEAEPAVPKGENYTSVVLRIKLQAITAVGNKKTISVIVKQSKTCEQSKNVLKELSAFRIETKMFKTILMQMDSLMDEFGDKRDTLWPKWYGGEPYSSMVLEDLKEGGYSTVDRTGWLDLNHSLLVLRNMARYHAMTKVLIGRGLLTEDDKGHYFFGPDSPMRDAFIVKGLSMAVKAMENGLGSWPAGWVELAQRLDRVKSSLCDKFTELYKNYDTKHEILCHGDMWSSNMMFKYMEYTQIPISVKFVDYQICHINSFIWDIVYFLYTSVKPSLRRAHKMALLSSYHQALSDNLKFFEYPGYVPTLEDVIDEEKRMAPAALAFLLSLCPIMVASVSDALNFEKILVGTPEEMYNMDAFTEKNLVDEIGDDIKDFAAAGVI